MESQPTALAVGTGKRRAPSPGAGDRTLSAFIDNRLTQPTESRSRPALASVRPWTHTLRLTGDLHRQSVHILEAEIERLCDEGVTGITLDLRGLTTIDPIGVAVIAFRSGLCERRGYDFGLIPGPQLIQSAFEQAGLDDSLPFYEGEVAASLRPALALGSRSRGDCEQ